jgi:hypothetical protein
MLSRSLPISPPATSRSPRRAAVSPALRIAFEACLRAGVPHEHRNPALALGLLSLVLAGCSGTDQASFPPVTTQNPVGSIQGSVFGGHAPIVSTHVFLLEATSTGYAAKAKSLLSSSSTATSGTYPVTEDQTTGSVTNGLYYVTSDSNGAFNITGDYTCDVGYPVYLYASGGSPGAGAALSITAISDVLSGGTYTYTFTAANLLYAGQSVQFSGLGGKWATLNGTTQTVVGTPTAGRRQSRHRQPCPARSLSRRGQLHQYAPLCLHE